jgi:hypothetical protein
MISDNLDLGSSCTSCVAVVVVVVPPAMLMWRSGLQRRKCIKQRHDGDYQADQNSHHLSFRFLAARVKLRRVAFVRIIRPHEGEAAISISAKMATYAAARLERTCLLGARSERKQRFIRSFPSAGLDFAPAMSYDRGRFSHLVADSLEIRPNEASDSQQLKDSPWTTRFAPS